MISSFSRNLEVVAKSNQKLYRYTVIQVYHIVIAIKTTKVPSSWTPTTARPWHEVVFFCVLTVFEGLGWGGAC